MPVAAHGPLACPQAPAPSRPRLRALSAPPQRRRRPSPRAVAAYALGLSTGFLAAAPASALGGAEALAGQLQLAGVAGALTVVAALRARAAARRR